MKISVKNYLTAINHALSESQIHLLETLFHFPDSTASAKELAAAMNFKSYHAANRQIGGTGKTIAQYIGITPPTYIDRKQDRPAYFLVVGDYDSYEEKNNTLSYGWKMTKNLRLAMESFLNKKEAVSKSKYRYFIQYHNADKLDRFPSQEINFNTNIKTLTLNTAIRYEPQIYTSKKQVVDAIGHTCFLIVGKTEKRKKQYYLWSYFKIEEVKRKKDALYIVYGTGMNVQKPVLLNSLEGFNFFLHYCGNFGIGFQSIEKHPFCSTLVSLTKKTKIENTASAFSKEDIDALIELNKRMQKISPEKRISLIQQISRKDKQIVDLLKKVKNYQCQFPNCKAVVKMSDGNNYVEVAHVKPVRKGGKSVLGNIIVLCPNHHKEFDYGILTITKQTKTLLQGELNGKTFQITSL